MIFLCVGEEGSYSWKLLCRSREEVLFGDWGVLFSLVFILGGWFGRGCIKCIKRKKVM